MKITVLGSGGGEGYPAMFCGCDHCNAARKAGGKSIRTLSQTLIGGDLLIDLPADTNLHALRYGLNLGDVANILVTHTHFDHFVPSVLNTRGHVFAHKIKEPALNVYGSRDVHRTFYTSNAVYPMNGSVEASITLNEMKPFEPTRVGSYTVTALPAKHAIGTLVALNYVIVDRDGKTLIYFHDTGFPNPGIIDFLADSVKHADCVFMDATMGVGANSDNGGHMSFEQDKRLAAILRERGIADGSTVLVANHITHNNAETHERIEEIFEGTGITVSYDGLTLEV